MKSIFLFVSVLCALAGSTWAEQAPAPQPGIEPDRLVRVYANLKNAEQMATGGVVLQVDELKATARKLTQPALKAELNAMVDRTLSAISSGPSDRRPETLAYIKNAMLRLLYDRDEDHQGHANWAKDHKDKSAAAIRECGKKIKEALGKI